MHFEDRASRELRGILRNIGDPDAKVKRTMYTGLLTAETVVDPVALVGTMSKMVREEPWSIRYCMRVVPIQRTVPARMEEILGEAGFISERIPKIATYKIFVKKRGSSMSGTEIIRKLAARIPNRVCMEKPGRMVLVEIIGAEAGIAVVRRDEVLSVDGVKRGRS